MIRLNSPADQIRIGLAGAIFGEGVCNIINGLRAVGGHHAVGWIQIIIGSVFRQPALHHMSAAVKIIPMLINFPPSAYHAAGYGTHIVTVSDAVVEPAGEHPSICMEIVGFSVDFLPSGHHSSVCIQIIP